MHITEQKQIHRYREQTIGYKWGEGRREVQDWHRSLKGTNDYVQNKSATRLYCRAQEIQIVPNDFQGSIIYEILNHYTVHLKLTVDQPYLNKKR